MSYITSRILYSWATCLTTCMVCMSTCFYCRDAIIVSMDQYAAFGRICAHITKLKKRTKPHWNQLPSQVIQQVAKRIHLGYDKFFDYLSDKKKGLSPRKAEPAQDQVHNTSITH